MLDRIKTLVLVFVAAAACVALGVHAAEQGWSVVRIGLIGADVSSVTLVAALGVLGCIVAGAWTMAALALDGVAAWCRRA